MRFRRTEETRLGASLLEYCLEELLGSSCECFPSVTLGDSRCDGREGKRPDQPCACHKPRAGVWFNTGWSGPWSRPRDRDVPGRRSAPVVDGARNDPSCSFWRPCSFGCDGG